MAILDLFRLDDKVAVITGAGRGIGAGIAGAFSELGANLVIGSRTEEQLVEVATRAKGNGAEVEIVAGSLAEREGMEALVARAVERFGRIDIVINNVGGSFPTGFPDTSERMFNEALRWNVTTAFNLTQVALPHLLASGAGSVINIASAVGRFPDRGFSAYGTAKAAMVHLTKNLALDLAPKVRVNAIAPGAIATSALGMVLDDEAIKQAMVDGTPLKRLGEVDDIAAAAVYLASPASGYVTGRIIDVDGGLRRANLELGLPDLE